MECLIPQNTLFLGMHQNEPKQLPNLLVIVYQLNVLNNNFTFMDYPWGTYICAS